MRNLRGCVLLLAAAVTSPGIAAVRWADCLRQPAAWYGSEEARATADSVLLHQTVHGGWPKNTDMMVAPAAEAAATYHDPAVRQTTIDNGATTTQLEFLARVITAGGGDETHPRAFLRGLDYLLDAQYANGGWPQYFPLRKGYYTRITYNDDAMVNVLTLIDDVAAGRVPYAFVDETRRDRSREAVSRGIECILRTQARHDGVPTAWCAQHDENTLEPAWARNFEPPSLSGNESVGLVRFLMGVEDPSPEIIAAVEGAVRWFEAVRIHSLRVDETPGEDGKKERRTVPDPTAPACWARFYELGTDRPIFMGRDKVTRYDFNEIERERRTGYGYLGDWPAKLLEKDYPKWRARHARP